MVLCVPAAILTVLSVISVGMETRDKRLVKDAELKRAKEELDGRKNK